MAISLSLPLLSITVGMSSAGMRLIEAYCAEARVAIPRILEVCAIILSFVVGNLVRDKEHRSARIRAPCGVGLRYVSSRIAKDRGDIPG